MFGEWIEECRERVSREHRGPLSWLGSRSKPLEMNPHDDVPESVLNHYEELLTSGQVVWGHTVMANREMYSPGRLDRPGNVVYSPERYFDNRPHRLADVADAVGALKYTLPDVPDLAEVAETISDEYNAVKRQWLPDQLTDGREVYLAWIILHRSRLPSGFLSDRLLPLLIHPEKTWANMILPIPYWAPSLVDEWGRLASKLEKAPRPGGKLWIDTATYPTCGDPDGEIRDAHVSLTTRAARKVRELAAQQGLGVEFYLAVSTIPKDRVFEPKISLAPTWLRDREDCFISRGVRIIVSREQIASLQGAVIDYFDSWYYGKGFRVRNPNEPEQPTEAYAIQPQPVGHHPRAAESPSNQSSRPPNRRGKPNWKGRLVLSFLLLFFAAGSFLMASMQGLQAGRRPLLIFAGVVEVGLAIVSLFVDLGDQTMEREAELRPLAMRGYWRGLKHSLPLLGVVSAVWFMLVVLTILLPIGSPISMLPLVYGLSVALAGYLWYGMARVQDGLGWPPVMFMSYYRSPIQATPHIWKNPKRYGPPLLLSVFGCLLLPISIGVLVLREHIPNTLWSSPPQLPIAADGDKGKQAQAELPTHKLFELDPRDYLSDLEQFDLRPGPWPIARNGKIGYETRDISVNGAPSPKGMGMHPPNSPEFASVKFHLHKKAAVFKAGGAVNDTPIVVTGRAVFEVLGDGKSLWQSAPVAKGERPTECSIDVSGIEVIELRTRAVGGNFGVNAVWLEPRLLQNPDTPDP
jgi:Fe-S cluster assembly iron-binding protein IscA